MVRYLLKLYTYDEHKIDTGNFSIKDDHTDEIRSIITEMILDGLCWTEPKILDKKEAEYVATQS